MQSMISKPRMTSHFAKSYLGKALLGLVLVCLIEFIQLGWFLVYYQREQRIAHNVEQVGGDVGWRYVGPSGISQSHRGSYRLLHRLRSVDLSRTVDQGRSELVSEIGTLTSLTSLFIGEGPTNDSDLAHLNRLVYLENLQLHQTGITDAGMAYLQRLNGLKRLWLGSTRIGDEGMKHLGKMTNLEKLILDHTLVTDDGILHLKKLTKLRDLALEVTATTPEGRDELRKLLPKCVVRPQP